MFDWLDTSTAPRPADVIIVLGGLRNRGPRAYELYRQGYAPWVLVSGTQGDVDAYGPLFEGSNVVYNPHAHSTWDEAQQNAAILRGRGVRSALIVTTNHHTRRAAAVYRAVMPELEASFVGVPISAADGPGWFWLRLNTAVREVIKSGYYFVQYGVRVW